MLNPPPPPNILFIGSLVTLGPYRQDFTLDLPSQLLQLSHHDSIHLYAFSYD